MSGNQSGLRKQSLAVMLAVSFVEIWRKFQGGLGLEKRKECTLLWKNRTCRNDLSRWH